MFNEAEYIGGICVPGCANYTRKQLDQLTDFVKRPQVGAKGLVWVKFNEDGTIKSSIDKFYSPEVMQRLKEKTGAGNGDLLLIMSGASANKTRVQLCTLRLEMGDRLGLRDKDKFECLWIIDFPLFEWSDEEQRLMSTHHPFTMPNPDDIPLLEEHPEGYVQKHTILYVTVSRLAAEACVYMTVSCRKRCSTSLALRQSVQWPSSDSLSTRSSMERLLTQDLRSALTALCR